MARSRRPPPRSSNTMLYIMVVQAATQFMKLEQKPPVTAALVLLNAVAFFRPGELVEFVPSVAEICLNPALVLKTRDWKRLLGSAFMHADESHLIYNMVSFLWKGVQLEGTMGSAQFAKLIVILTVLSQGCTVLISKLLADYLGFREPFYQQCAVGFSGVIFALKVVLNWHSSTHSSIAGFFLPTKYAAWGELLAIQYATPQASFVGHLGGIVAGLLLVYLPRMVPRGLPFVEGLRALAPTTLASVETGRVAQQAPRRSRWFSSWGTAGASDAGVDGESRGGRSSRQEARASRDSHSWGSWWGTGGGASSSSWGCRSCTFENQGGAHACEMCGEPREGVQSTKQAGMEMGAGTGVKREEQQLSAEEIRRRRLESMEKASTMRR